MENLRRQFEHKVTVKKKDGWKSYTTGHFLIQRQTKITDGEVWNWCNNECPNGFHVESIVNDDFETWSFEEQKHAFAFKHCDERWRNLLRTG